VEQLSRGFFVFAKKEEKRSKAKRFLMAIWQVQQLEEGEKVREMCGLILMVYFYRYNEEKKERR